MGFQLAYYNVTFQHINHYAMETPPGEIWYVLGKKKKEGFVLCKEIAHEPFFFLINY